MIGIFLSIAPAIAIAVFVYLRDLYEKEPLRLLMLCFFTGGFIVLPAGLTEQYIEQSFLMAITGDFAAFIRAFFVTAMVEEFYKFLILIIVAFPRKDFNEPFDGITYAVMIGMGFAAVENLFYFSWGGVDLVLLRTFSSVPAHATFAVLMGYHVGAAKFTRRPYFFLMNGLLWPILMHGAYNFCLMQSSTFIAFGAGLSLIIGIYFSVKAMRLHNAISPFKDGNEQA